MSQLHDRVTLALSVAAVLFAAGESQAGELPSQTMMERRYRDTEPIRTAPVMKWKLRTLQGLDREEWSHVLVHEGVMYGTARAVLHAVDVESGKLLWSVKGPSGHPAIKDGVLYATGKRSFYAVDLKTRKVKWKLGASVMQDGWRQSNGFMKPATVLYKNVAYFGGKGGSTTDCYYHAVDIKTGKMLWKKRYKNEPKATNITIGGGRLYGASFPPPDPARGSSPHGRRGRGPGAFFAMDPSSGDILWVREGLDTSCKPVYQDEVVYVAANNELMALDARTGKTLWKMSAGIHALGMALNGELLLIGGVSSRLLCVDVRTQKQVWSFTEKGLREILSPVICRDVVILSTCGQVGGKDLKTGRTSPIFGLELKTGKKLWRAVIPGTELFDESGTRRGWNTYVCGWAYPEGKRLFMLSFTGKFYCFEAER